MVKWTNFVKRVGAILLFGFHKSWKPKFPVSPKWIITVTAGPCSFNCKWYTRETRVMYYAGSKHYGGNFTDVFRYAVGILFVFWSQKILTIIIIALSSKKIPQMWTPECVPSFSRVRYLPTKGKGKKKKRKLHDIKHHYKNTQNTSKNVTKWWHIQKLLFPSGAN